MIKGFGGVFWRTKDLEGLKQWYSDVLKIEINNWNVAMIASPSDETIFSLFKEDDTYFPQDQQVMLNFEVHNLDDMVTHLENIGVPLAKKQENSDYGKFAWIKDPDGRLIELWEK